MMMGINKEENDDRNMERIESKSATKSTKKRKKSEEKSRGSTDCVVGRNFQKLSFLVRRRDVSKIDLPCIWSVENHIMIVKWVPTDVAGQFQITNRYNLWNGIETHRYVQVSMSRSDIESARDSGLITLGAQAISKIREQCVC